MKKEYLKILVNIAIILAILFVLDLLVGWIGERYMRWINSEPRDGDAALVNYNVNAVKADVAIIGSSTAICHYDPDMIHDSLWVITGEDLKVFNMGVSNQRLAYDYYGLKCLLDRTTPKIVIVDVWASFIGEGDPSFSFEAFRPYANINPNIKEMLINHDAYGFMEMSNLYCFNTELVKLLMSPFKPKGANGFSKSKATIAKIEKGIVRDTTALLPLSVREFDGIISLSKDKGFKLFVVMSPTLRSSDTTSLSYQYIKCKCYESDITFLDYSNDERFYQIQYFRDISHLNFYGAEFFTQELLNDIKPYILSEWSKLSGVECRIE